MADSDYVADDDHGEYNDSADRPDPDPRAAAESRRLQHTIERAVAGDEQAFTDLYRRYADHILFHVKAKITHPEDAESVAQDVALQMFRAIGRLQNPYAFQSWMQRIINRVCVNYNRREGKKKDQDVMLEAAEDIESPALVDHPEDLAISEDLRARLYNCVLKLPPRQRDCILMCYYDEMSYHEIAEALGIAEGTVSSALGKAKKTLKELLAHEGIEGGESSALASLGFGPVLAASLRYGAAHSVSQAQIDRLCQAVALKIKETGAAKGAAGGQGDGGRGLVGWLIPVIVVLLVLAGGAALVAKFVHTPTSGSASTVVSYSPQATVEIEGGDVTGAGAGADANIGTGTTGKTAVAANAATAATPVRLHLKIHDNSRVAGWTITAAAGGKILNAGSGLTVAEPLRNLAPGTYEISWKLISSKGVPGAITQSFTIH